MPRIPSYQSQAQLNPLGDASINVQTSPEGFGAGKARALMGAGQQLGNIAVQVKAHEDDAKAKQAEINYQRDLMSLLDSPEGGYLHKRGQDAYDSRETINQQLQDLQTSYLDNLENESQKGRFKNLSSRRMLAAMDTIGRHAAKEFTTWQNGVNSASAMQAMEDAASRPYDPGYVYQSLERGKSEIEQLSERNGDPQELIIAKRAEYENLFHKKMIVSMINDDPASAREYFKLNSDEMFAESRAAIEKQLKNAELVGAAQNQADLIRQKAMIEGGDPLDLARAIKDPELRKDTEALLRVYEADDRRREAEQEKVLVDNFWTTFVQNPDPRNIPKVFPAPQRLKALEYAKMKASGKDVETDWLAYQQLRLEAADPKTRSTFASRSLYEYRMQLGDAELKQLIGIQAKLKEGDNKTRLDLDRVFSNKQVLDQRLEQVGIKTNPKPNTDAADRLSKFQRRLDERLNQFEETNGRKVNEKEYLDEVDNLLREVVIDEGWWDTSKLLFEVNVTDIGDVPETERRAIEQALIANGLDTTEENIKFFYLQAQYEAK